MIFFFFFRYSIIAKVFDETEYAWNLCLYHSNILYLSFSQPFHFSFSEPSTSHISLFLTEIDQPCYDETWYTWQYPALTICPDGHSQNQKNPITITLYLFHSPFFHFLSLFFRPFLLLYFYHYFIYFLNC